MKKIVINLALFQIGWLVCVIGGNYLAVAFTLLALLIHNWLVLSQRLEWRFIAGVALVGCAWDALLANSGVISYADAALFGIPLWLMCLWLLFATTFMHGLLWLQRHLGVAVVLAAVLGPASYWFGANLGDAQFGTPLLLSLAIISVGWAILFPCGIYYAGRLKA